MADRSKGVMGKSVVDFHKTGRIDIYSRDDGDIFGKTDVKPTRHGHDVLDEDNKAQSVREQGEDKPAFNTGVSVPKDSTPTQPLDPSNPNNLAN